MMERVAGALGHARRLVVGESPRGEVDRTRLIVGERHTTPPIRAESRSAAQSPRRPWPTLLQRRRVGGAAPARMSSPLPTRQHRLGEAERSPTSGSASALAPPRSAPAKLRPRLDRRRRPDSSKRRSSPGSGSGVGEAWRRPAAPGVGPPPHRLADVSAQRLGRTAADGPRRAVTVRSWPPPTG